MLAEQAVRQARTGLAAAGAARLGQILASEEMAARQVAITHPVAGAVVEQAGQVAPLLRHQAVLAETVD